MSEADGQPVLSAALGLIIDTNRLESGLESAAPICSTALSDSLQRGLDPRDRICDASEFTRECHSECRGIDQRLSLKAGRQQYDFKKWESACIAHETRRVGKSRR